MGMFFIGLIIVLIEGKNIILNNFKEVIKYFF